MKVEFIDGLALKNTFEDALAAAEEVRVAVAWATASNPLHEALLADDTKVKALVVGLHFHQTDPDFIDAWRGRKGTPLRLVRDTSGVFHPKVYLFRAGKRGVAIVGSANFTKAGFASNTEAGLHLTGRWEEAPFVELRELVEAPRPLVEPTDEWLASYRRAHERRQRMQRVLATEDQELPGDDLAFQELSIDFGSYARRIIRAGDERPAFVSRGLTYRQWLAVLDAMKELPGWPSVARLGAPEWKKLLGVVQFPEGDRSVDFRTFGWVFPRQMQRLLADDDARLAIEQIPPSGAVPRRSWDRFVQGLKGTFKSPAITTASRLLVLRRPDLFLSANARSMENLAVATGHTVRDYDDYWNLHQVLWSMPWARAKRPKKKKLARIWDARVALLDVLFYDPA